MDAFQKKLREQLIAITRNFLMESHTERAYPVVSLTASLEKELGISSLEKSELIYRIEKTLNVSLPTATMVEAQTLSDICNIILKTRDQNIEIKFPELPKEQRSVEFDVKKASSLQEVLFLYKENDPERNYLYLLGDTGVEKILKYGDLYDSANQLAAGLIARGLKPRETVAIMLPTSVEFFFAFFGVLLAGGIPVPIYPPLQASQVEEYAKREAIILRNAGVRFLITFKKAKGLSKLLQAFVPSLIDVETVSSLMKEDSTFEAVTIDPSDIAFIQYTSGSTGNPKGVALTHQNLLANIHAYGAAVNLQANDVIVSWLPLYHDMGLIGACLGSLFYGAPLVLLSPLSFLAHPEQWLWAVHYYRGTISAAPNFAYEICVKKIADERLAGLDLSCWRLALNGAEKIYPSTLERFYKKLKPFKLSKTTLFPVYGLAESSVALTFPAIGKEAIIDRIDKTVFETEGKALAVTDTETLHYEFVNCGRALPHHQIRVVDDNNNPLPNRTVGNLQFKGPSAMIGYYNNSEATERVMHDGWVETGDLAYLVDGDLFLTGRKKDLIIKAGRNYYPADVELIVEQVQGIRKGCVAAFGVRMDERGTENLVIVAEKSDRTNLANADIIEEIYQRMSEQVGIAPDDVVLTAPRTIPKTSSGKLRRSSCKERYLNHQLKHRHAPVWLQVTKLFTASIAARVKKFFGTIFKFIYTIYAAILGIIALIPTILVVFLLPRKLSALSLKAITRTLLACMFCPIKTNIKIKQKNPAVFIANHASYIDFIALIAKLPSNAIFVGKKELAKIPLLGRMMRRMKHILVDRFNLAENESDFNQLKTAVEKDLSIMIFPEGTFGYQKGVRPFKLGAFKLAVELNLPIYPIALSGTRDILTEGHILLRPKKITMTVLPILKTEKNEWEEIIRLRDQSRDLIAKALGEEKINL